MIPQAPGEAAIISLTARRMAEAATHEPLDVICSCDRHGSLPQHDAADVPRRSDHA